MGQLSSRSQDGCQSARLGTRPDNKREKKRDQVVPAFSLSYLYFHFYYAVSTILIFLLCICMEICWEDIHLMFQTVFLYFDALLELFL